MTDWEPGDPLYRHPHDAARGGGVGRQHVRRIIQVIPLGNHEVCHCQDRASWPDPAPGTVLKPTKALEPVWGEPS